MDGETTEAKRRRLDGGGDDEPSGPPAEQPPPDNGETDARPNGGTDSVAAADAPEASKRAFVSGSVSGGGAAGPETALIAQRVEATGSAGTLLFCGGTNWDTIGRRPKDKQKAAGGSASQDRNLWGPHRLAWPHRVKAVFSGCSACHTVLLTEEGQAYTWGRNDKGQLGQSDLKRRDVPTLVETLRDSLVVGAACGRGHTLFLTDHGVVFGCGDNKMGQCGVGSQNASVHVPTRVAFKLRPAVRVSCGGEFSVLVDCRGHAYTFGCPEYGQLGHNTDGRYFVTSNKLQFKCELVPRRVQVFIDRSREGHVVSVDDVHIIDVASGLNHTIALDERKRCFSWGFGGYGRLGHNEPKDEMVPRLIKAFDGPNRGLCSIHAGGTFSMAVSELEKNHRRPAGLLPPRSAARRTCRGRICVSACPRPECACSHHRSEKKQAQHELTLAAEAHTCS
ncbi:protein RCC2 isoform X4 [Amblyomma americanum]